MGALLTATVCFFEGIRHNTDLIQNSPAVKVCGPKKAIVKRYEIQEMAVKVG